MANHFSTELTVAGSAPVPAGHQWPSERTLESSYTGQESLLRTEPWGSVVVVHAQKRAGTGAAGAGAETHNIHAFVHPGETGVAFDVFVANRGKKRSKRPGRRREREREEGREGRVHIFITDWREAEEEGEEKKDMTGPGDLSALGGAQAVYVVFKKNASFMCGQNESRRQIKHRLRCRLFTVQMLQVPPT